MTSHSYLRPVRPDEVFDHTLYGDFDQSRLVKTAEVVPYSPAPAPVIPPGMDVVIDADGRPCYRPASVVGPAPVPQPDVLAERMRALLPAGLGVAAAEGGAWVMFWGVSIAAHALVSLAIVAVGGTVVAMLAKSAGGVHVGHFHQGDGASFRVGR